MTDLEIGDIVMCTVERIAGTLVFVNIDGNGQGSIILSEIAPGRIRNLRDYVVPKKRIICKVIRIKQDHIELSLRRVTPKEQKEIREKYKLEKSYKSLIKTVLKEKAEEIVENILKENTLYEVLEEAKQNPKILEKFAGKANTEKILKILNSQKQKKLTIKKEFNLSSNNSKGLDLIRNTLKDIKDGEINYISAGKYSIKTEDTDPKKADNKLKEILTNIEKKAKKLGLEFSIK